MKATGIVRRVDDLGRIVIPKEIRRTMRITEGYPMEMFVIEDGIMLRKYNPIQNISSILQDLKNAIDSEGDIQNKAFLLRKLKEVEEILTRGDRDKCIQE